jgi:hypothetical protein
MIAKSLLFMLGNRPDRFDKAVASRGGASPVLWTDSTRGGMVGVLEPSERCGSILRQI